MPTELDKLLEQLGPERVLDEVAARTDQTINSFPSTVGRITNWDDFRAYLVRFVAHVDREAL